MNHNTKAIIGLLMLAQPAIGGPVPVNHALSVDAAASAYTNASLDFSHAPTGTTALTITGGPNDYNGGSIHWGHLELAGNGTGIGLVIAANHITIDSLTVHDFGTDVQLGPNGYSVTLNQPFLYNASMAFYCPQLPNTGEQIVINGGSLFNSGYGVMGGGCGMTIMGTSIDGMRQQSIVWWGGGFRGYGLHIENFTSPTGPIIENAGGNAYSFMDFEGLEVYQDTGTAQLSLIKNPNSGASITFLGHTQLSGGVTSSAKTGALPRRHLRTTPPQ